MTPVDAGAAPARLIIIGAVDIAVALCRVAHAVGWRSFVADPREGCAVAARFPEAEQVIAACPDEAFARLGPLDANTAIAVLTHDPEVDDRALATALRSDAGYVGAVGSRATQASRRSRLLERGLTRAELERLSGPIGLDLGGRGHGEIALAIAAEVVALRHGRGGDRLKDASGRIGAEDGPREGAPSLRSADRAKDA